MALCLGQIENPDGAMGFVLGACLILLCLVPLVLWSIRTIIEATIERKTAAHIIILWKYKPLNLDDAL
jgi:Ca2+/Na+ antiporter